MILLCVVLGLLRTDFTAPGGHKRVELSYWNGWTGPDGEVALQMIRQFNQENPDIQVTMQRMAWATYYNKLMVAESDGRGPEVFIIHASTLPRMSKAGFVGDVSDLYRGADAIPEGDFDPYVLNQVRYDKSLIGLPLDIHPQGLYCNADMLKKAGIVDAKGNAKPPENREEFLKALKAMIQDPGKTGHPDDWGYALTTWQNNFQSLMPQFGGHYLDDQGRADLANPGNVKALEFLEGLAKEHLVPPPENALGWNGFREGKVGMVWEGVYMVGDLKRLNDLHYIGAPIPQIGPKPGTMADSHVMCIRAGLSPEKRAAAERFLRFFSRNSIQWAAAGQVPARISVRNTDEFRHMQVQSQFARQIPTMMYPPRTDILFQMSLEISLAVEKVLRGRAGAEEALKAASENSQHFLDQDRQERGAKS